MVDPRTWRQARTYTQLITDSFLTLCDLLELKVTMTLVRRSSDSHTVAGDWNQARYRYTTGHIPYELIISYAQTAIAIFIVALTYFVLI